LVIEAYMSMHGPVVKVIDFKPFADFMALGSNPDRDFGVIYVWY
jgi:hypothetical protein